MTEGEALKPCCRRGSVVLLFRTELSSITTLPASSSSSNMTMGGCSCDLDFCGRLGVLGGARGSTGLLGGLLDEAAARCCGCPEGSDLYELPARLSNIP
jgi:hypothetical protein